MSIPAILSALSPVSAWTFATLLEKLFLLLCAALLAGEVVLRFRTTADRTLAKVFGWSALVLGLLCALFSAAVIFSAMRMAGVTNFWIVFPTLVAPAYAVLLGVVAWAISSPFARSRPTAR